MTDLSIVAYAPVINQSKDTFHERLASTEGEQITSSIDRGFDVAKLVLTGSPDYLNGWFANGLIRDIVIKGPDGQVIWNGFISKMTFAKGDSARVKSIEKFYNRVVYVYRVIDGSGVAGAQTTTTVNDTTTQGTYGIKTILVSGGERTSAEATAEANNHLNELSQLDAGEVITTASKIPSIQVDMMGYSYMADWFTYSNGSVSTAKAHTVAAAIMATDPNGVLSTADTNIDASATDVQTFYDGKERGWKAIQALAGIGESGNPWTAAIYEGRNLTFKVAEGVDSSGNPKTTNKYLPLERQATDAGFRLVDQAGKEVDPWDVRPDRLIFTSGRRGDLPVLVSQVTFTAPRTLKITGSDVKTPMARQVRF